MQHFECVIKDELKKRKERGADAEHTHDFDAIPDDSKLESSIYEVADMNFGETSMKRTEHLSKLADMRNEFMKNNIRTKMSHDD